MLRVRQGRLQVRLRKLPVVSLIMSKRRLLIRKMNSLVFILGAHLRCGGYGFMYCGAQNVLDLGRS